MKFKQIITNISILELALVQSLIFGIIWLSNEYLALLMSVTISSISLGILLISFLVEVIEKSKISKSYFIGLLTITLVPIFVGIGYALLNNGIDFYNW